MNFERGFTRGLILLTVFATMMAVACGGGGNSASSASPGTSSGQQTPVQLTIADAPGERILSFDITINSISLTNSAGQQVQVLTTPTKVELTHLVGTTQPIGSATVPQGTYTQADIAISNPNITFIDNAGNQVTKSISANFTTTIKFAQPLTISSQSLSLNFDMSLANSVAIDLTNNTVTINPKFLFSCAPLGDRSPKPESGKLDDVVGVVSATDTTKNTLTIRTRMGTNSLTCSVNAQTKWDDVSGLSGLQNGQIVSLEGTVQQDGSILCTEVELKAGTSVLSIEARGFVVKTTGSPVQQFSFGTQEVNIGGMQMPLMVPGRIVNIGVTHSTTSFAIDWGTTSQSGLPFTPTFDDSTLFAGQTVEVQADTAPTTAGTNPLLNAKRIVLKPGAFTGTVSNYAAINNGSQFTLTFNQDSAFKLLSGASSVNVIVPTTADTGTLDLSKSNGTVLRVRGLVFQTPNGYFVVASRILAPESN